MLSFSIATPCRNSLQVLRKCTGSVRNQKGIDCEHIIQDAQSTDGTVEWLKEQNYLKWASEPDNGMYDAINRAWARCRGDIVSYLNADEQYLPGTLKFISDVFETTPGLLAVFGDYIICDAETGIPFSVRREIPLRSFYIRNGPLYAMSCTLFFRRSLLEKGWLTLDSSYTTVADADMVLSLLNKGVHFMHIHKYLSLFGVTGNNLSLKKETEKEILLWRSLHGNSCLFKNFARFLRFIEKSINGCYIKRDIEYEFCMNESGETRKIYAENVSPRWKYTS